MPIDRIRIKERLKTGEKYLSVLNQILSMNEMTFLADFEVHLKAERVFEVLSQIMLDICTHIIAASGILPPSSYADCMYKLADVGLFPREQAQEYSEIIKMRNLIVHQYSDIDYALLIEGLKHLNIAFQAFKTYIIRFLSREGALN